MADWALSEGKENMSVRCQIESQIELAYLCIDNDIYMWR